MQSSFRCPHSSQAIQIALGIAEVLEVLLEDHSEAVMHRGRAVLENRHLGVQCCGFDVFELAA